MSRYPEVLSLVMLIIDISMFHVSGPETHILFATFATSPVSMKLHRHGLVRRAHHLSLVLEDRKHVERRGLLVPLSFLFFQAQFWWGYGSLSRSFLCCLNDEIPHVFCSLVKSTCLGLLNPHVCRLNDPCLTFQVNLSTGEATFDSPLEPLLSKSLGRWM